MEGKKPFFSVIIPTHNRPQFLPKAVNSVLSQKYQNFEIIVINDASVEDYTEAEEFLKTDIRIRYFKVDNKNRSKTRNFGIEKALGDWICFLDDDDIYYDNHLITFVEAILSKYDVSFFHTYCVINKKEKKSNQKFKLKEKDTSSFEYATNTMITTNSISIKRELINSVKYNTDYYILEDYDLYFRIFGKGYSVCGLNKFTTEYVFHPNNTNNNSYKNHLEAYRIYLKLFRDEDIIKRTSKEFRRSILYKYNKFVMFSKEELPFLIVLKAYFNTIRFGVTRDEKIMVTKLFIKNIFRVKKSKKN